MKRRKEKFSRLNPQNREVAFAYQFQDEAKGLLAIALVSPEAFEQRLMMFETLIKAYRSKRLRKQCEKAQAKHAEVVKWMEEHYPTVGKAK